MTPKKREARDMKKSAKRSMRYEEKRLKKAADEAIRVSTSSAPLRGPISNLIPSEISLIQEGAILNTPTIVGVADVAREAK